MTPEERRAYQRAYYKKRKELNGSYRGLGFFNDDPKLILAAWVWLQKGIEK